MLNLVLILDTETTDIDPTKARIIEVGAVTYSIPHASIVDCFSTVCNSGDNPAELINGIPPAVLVHAGDPWPTIRAMASRCDAVLAHNSDFDEGMLAVAGIDLRLPWVDTCGAITWPKQSRPGANLTALCLDHGLGVCEAHRALTDCNLIARLLTRCHELGTDLNALLAPGLEPRALYQALVSYDDRDKARAAGFKWLAERKQWQRKLSQREVESLPFKCRPVS